MSTTNRERAKRAVHNEAIELGLVDLIFMDGDPARTHFGALLTAIETHQEATTWN